MPQRLIVGDATVNVLAVGRFYAPAAALMLVPEAECTPALAAELAQPRVWPCWAVHIARGELSILVDPGEYHPPPGDPWALPFVTPPADLGQALAAAGIAPAAVRHVVITHAHEDHYAGAVWYHDGEWRPRFPAARHYLGRADWEDAGLQQALADPDTVAGRVLASLWHGGLLEPVDGIGTLAEGITLVPAPGESPGHLILRLHSHGQTLYCLGDLYHHPLEVEHPAWVAAWADPVTTVDSRERLVEAALAENALLIASHIPTVGRLVRTPTGVAWRAVAELG
jgi:glyoxylase-like metal-dependent hydrolase (beta-lactamase superfamily II)